MANRKAFDSGKTRTIALIGHRSAGKTSLGEVMLRVAGVTRVTGNVERRTALLDHSEEERRKGQSIQLSYAWLEWRDHQINLVDTPGSDAVEHERAMGLGGVDAAVLVVDATAGIQVGTERALDEVTERGLPLMVVLNKVDRQTDPGAVLQALEAALHGDMRLVQLQLPFLDEGHLAGVVSVIDGQVLRYDAEGEATLSAEPVPERYQGLLEAARERLAEQVAVTDDGLLEHYLEFLELPPDALARGLAEAIRQCRLVPVLLAAATQGIGAQPVLDGCLDLLPSPLERRPPVARDEDGAPVPITPEGPFVAQVLSVHTDEEGGCYRMLRVWGGQPPKGPWTRLTPEETLRGGKVSKLYQVRGPRRATARSVGAGALLATWDPLEARPGDTVTDGARLRMPVPALPPPMMSYVVRPDDARGLPRLQAAAAQLAVRDAALTLRADDSAGGVVIAGANEAHLELTIERLRRLVGAVRTELPPVAYRETPAGTVENVQGLHLIEDRHGLVHEFGRCTVDVSPRPPDDGVRFSDTLPPDDIDILPARYRPAIDEGIRRATAHGPTAGYPVVGLEVTLTGGEYDILQSTDDHFRRAGEKALRAALQRSGTRLLEPWCLVEVDTPQAAVGDLLSDISSHRGRILGLNALENGARRGCDVRIQAACPYRELRTFASRLQAATQGRGRYVSSPSHYEPLPRHLESEAIETSPFRDQLQLAIS